MVGYLDFRIIHFWKKNHKYKSTAGQTLPMFPQFHNKCVELSNCNILDVSDVMNCSELKLNYLELEFQNIINIRSTTNFSGRK